MAVNLAVGYLDWHEHGGAATWRTAGLVVEHIEDGVLLRFTNGSFLLNKLRVELDDVTARKLYRELKRRYG
jgi:hypothetical protein